MKKKYGLVSDGTYSHITFCSDYEGDYCRCGEHHEETFVKFSDAKKALINYMKDHIDDWSYALKNARQTKKSNITE